MSRVVSILALAGLALSGCLEVQSQPAPPPTTMSSWGPLGGFTMSSGMTACAGHATLNGGMASVSDPCFTGDANVVLCTDTTAPNPVKCSPAPGYLAIAGAPGDTIAWARVR